MKKHLARFLCVGALLGFLLIILLSLTSGCASSAAGIKRESKWSAPLAAAVDFLQKNVAPLVPQPYGSVTTLVLGGCGAALGAWHLSQEKRLAKLNGAPKPAPPV